MEDYVIYQLTKQAKIDYSLATRTMAFDIGKLEWSEEIFSKADIDAKLMSEPVPTGTCVGTVRKEIAGQLGLSEQTRVVAVSHDQVAAAVGAGVFDADKAVDGAGTVECITPIFDEMPDMDIMYEGNFAVVPYVIPGKYVCYAFSYTGGALVQWCTQTLAKQETEQAKGQGISVNELLEGQSKGPTGLMVLPHFAGAATPYMDTGAKGAIVGLTTGHNAADIYRACMEGVVYEMVLNMEYLQGSGMRFTGLQATGGGARSKVWMQMKADMLNMPITALATADAGTVGCAMLTGIAMGCFKDLDDAAVQMIQPTNTYYPDQVMHEKYMKIYRKYRGLYQALRPLMEVES